MNWSSGSIGWGSVSGVQMQFSVFSLCTAGFFCRLLVAAALPRRGGGVEGSVY